jgi:hypothetical protein
MRRVGDGELFGAFPFLIKLSADGGDQGSEFRSAMSRFWRASMSSQATDFVALLKRRIVERTSMARSMSTSGQGAGMPSVTRRSPSPLAYSHSMLRKRCNHTECSRANSLENGKIGQLRY